MSTRNLLRNPQGFTALSHDETMKLDGGLPTIPLKVKLLVRMGVWVVRNVTGSSSNS